MNLIRGVALGQRPIRPWRKLDKQNMYYIYFARSLKNGKVYVGYTSKTPEVRVNEHNASANAWSKVNKPFKLIYYEQYLCIEDAKKKELFYKSRFGRKVKKAIITTIGE